MVLTFERYYYNLNSNLQLPQMDAEPETVANPTEQPAEMPTEQPPAEEPREQAEVPQEESPGQMEE